MNLIEITSRVGEDGMLVLSLSLGPNEANREVKVVVEPVDASPPASHQPQKQWREFVEDMAGCISDSTFVRPDQGEYEHRNEAFS